MLEESERVPIMRVAGVKMRCIPEAFGDAPETYRRRSSTLDVMKSEPWSGCSDPGRSRKLEWQTQVMPIAQTPAITVTGLLGPSRGHLSDDVPICPVLADSKCLFYCAAASRDAENWVRTHRFGTSAQGVARCKGHLGAGFGQIRIRS